MTKTEEWYEEAAKHGDAIRTAQKELAEARSKRDEFWNQLPKGSIRRHILSEYYNARCDNRPCPRFWYGLGNNFAEDKWFFEELDDLGITEVWYWQGRRDGALNIQSIRNNLERNGTAFIQHGWEKVGETDSYCVCGNEVSTYDIWRKKET